MQNIPTVTRNLLIINVICFLLQQVLETRDINLSNWLSLHFLLAPDFNPLQFITYLFLHGSFMHLFFNMFSLWMFGSLIERTLGTRRFLIYYFICGIGAGFCQEIFQFIEYYGQEMNLYSSVRMQPGIIMPMDQYLNNWRTIGASGACYGILLAFGRLYPNERIMLLLPPIPMKAKYFVAGYAVIEMIAAYNANDNVAHLAHLGGMLFGWFLLSYWLNKSHARQTWGGWNYEAPAKRKPWFQRFKERFQTPVKRNSASVGNAHHTPQHESDHEYNMRKKAEEERMDEILDKIRTSGYDSLTTEEKQELFRISRR